VINIVFITGITGFVGSYLAEYLLKEKLEVYGTVRRQSKRDNIKHIENRLKLYEGDLRDAHYLENVLDVARPDYIFHLASASSVLNSWKDPVEVMETNVIGTVNLFEAIRKSEIDSRLQIAGSSEEYGIVYPEELPVKETNILRPISPYAVSKVAQDKLSYQYYQSYGLKTIVTRAFNTTGPGRPAMYAISGFAKQIAEIEKGKQPIIHVGNLNAQRDFSDVRDIARAYWLSVQKCEPGEVYNVCSEKTRSIQEVLDLLLSLSNRSIRVQENPSFMRPSDIAEMQGDCTKFRKQTGWKPEIEFEQTLIDLLDYWRSKV